MKKMFLSVATFVFSMFFAAYTAYSAMLYVDAAPNMYGAPDAYESWWTSTKLDILTGNFTSMKNSYNSANVGTNKFDVRDTTVYNFGDYGNRLNLVYWLPGETIASLTEDKFKISVNYFFEDEKFSFTKEAFGKKWVTPTAWEEYNGGVIGTAGVGWGVPEWVVDEDSLAGEFAYLIENQGNIIFKTKTNNGQSSRLNVTPQSAPVPEPMTILLFGTGLIGLAGVRMRRKK